MSDALQVLAGIVLAASSSGSGNVIYTATGVTTMVSSFRLVNSSTSTSCTVRGYHLVSGGTQTAIIPMDLSLAAGEAYVDSDPITLEASDSLKFMASAASVVHCTVFGIEHS